MGSVFFAAVNYRFANESHTSLVGADFESALNVAAAGICALYGLIFVHIRTGCVRKSRDSPTG